MSLAAWVAVGRRITRVANTSAWALGDWLLFGERVYRESYRAAVEATGLDYQTLRNYASVARRFEPSRRRATLSFQHHAEVAALPEPEQDLWLRRAERNGWTRNALRRQLAELRAAQPPKEPDRVLRLPLTDDCEDRWRRAAASAGLPLLDWLTAVADAAAADARIAIGRPRRHSGP